VTGAEGTLKQAQGHAVAEAALRTPTWLLPASLDAVAFVLVLFGAAPGKPAKTKPAAKGTRKTTKRKAKTAKAKPSATVVRLAAANDR
jgi:hypothetical protein